MNLMYSCRKVAELVSQSMDEPLGPIDRLRLRMHLSMCANCRNVEQQMQRVGALSGQLFVPDSALDDDEHT